jgi:hypothetical protein
MNRATRLLRILQTLMAFAIGVYAVVGELVGTKTPHQIGIIYVMLVLIAACMAGVGHIIRRHMIENAERTLTTDPENSKALRLWVGAQVLSFAVADAVALLGLLARLLGSTFFAVSLFYLGGLFLFWVFRPARSVPVVLSPSSSPQSVP